jgi:hypothetical protein
MYEVWVYDEVYGQFIPYRPDGKRVEFEGWNEAQTEAERLTTLHLDKQFKVQYGSSVRRKRRG